MIYASAVYRDTIPSELRRFSAAACSHGQRIPAPRVTDLADNHDFFQLADTTNHCLLGRLKKQWKIHLGRHPVGVSSSKARSARTLTLISQALPAPAHWWKEQTFSRLGQHLPAWITTVCKWRVQRF
jgi:hypothetical protein